MHKNRKTSSNIDINVICGPSLIIERSRDDVSHSHILGIYNILPRKFFHRTNINIAGLRLLILVIIKPKILTLYLPINLVN